VLSAATPEERRAYLTFALVGAGPTGVELAGQIREVATKTLTAEFRTISPEDARVLLFDGGSAPLAAFGPKLSQKAAETLQRLSTWARSSPTSTGVSLLVRDQAGEQARYDANTVLWTAGVEAPPGGSGCLSTSPSSPATATASGLCRPGGWPSPEMSAASGPSPPSR
jgi:NADH:ubiquinone reductase (H+-translocating)